MQTALLTRSNLWTHIIKSSDALVNELINLESSLGTTGPGIFSKDHQSFLAGLTSLIESRVPIHVREGRIQPNVNVTQLPQWLDRAYQRQAVTAAIANRTGILKLPTGSGKTRIACGIMKAVPCTWLYLVHKANLVEDVANTYEELTQEKAGRVYSDENDYRQRVVCATFKTAYNREEILPLLQSVQGVIVDEVHNIPAITNLAVALNTTNAYWRIGLSATPLFREDNRDIHTIALTGPEIFSISVDELVKQKYIVEPVVEWVTVKTNKPNLSYLEAYDQLIIHNANRNTFILNAALNNKTPTIIFVKEHRHQQVLKTMFNNKHVAIVNEHTSIFERQEIVKQIKDGSLEYVISSQVFSEGMDAPNLQTVINATAAMSWVQAIQDLGRGTRPYPNKNKFTVIDFNDTGNSWFEEHTKQRYAAYIAAGFKCKAPNFSARKVLEVVEKRGKMYSVKRTRGINFTYLFSVVLFGLLWLLWHR